MPDGSLLSGEIGNILNFISAAAGLGTAAMGLVDSSKAFSGGPSNIGFSEIKRAVTPLLPGTPGTSAVFGQDAAIRTLKANWLNGVPKLDQKAKAKGLIHLGLTKGNAASLAEAAGVNKEKLASLAEKTASGTAPTPDELNVLGQFDMVVSAVLDDAYERGDQQYRNGSKFLAMLVATILGVVGGWLVFSQSKPAWDYFGSWQFGLSLIVGLSAAPLAPISKDLASSLQAAVAAIGTVKR
jgi:hypothetical protein